jgi:hypothetical protein
LRTLNILSMTAWVISLLVMSFQSGEVNIAEKLILLIGPLAVAGITTDRALNSMHTAPNENIPHI